MRPARVQVSFSRTSNYLDTQWHSKHYTRKGDQYNTFVLFAAAICVSTALLFLVQPLFASLVLAILGGSPSVWNTATMFFQLALLVGYVYAHFTRNRLSPKKQVVVHGIVALLPLRVLPIAVPSGWTPPTQSNPIPWLLVLMRIEVGLPFFAVSTTSPLIQS